MKAVIGLLLMLVRVSLGVETFCDGRQNKTQCYGALGGTVDIRLIDKVPERPRFALSKSNRIIVRWTGTGPVRQRLETLEFTYNNGTMRITNLNRTDDGEYKLGLFEDGRRTAMRTLQLNIQAPVSSVQLNYECLSQGEKRMSCSSEGDSPQFSWTLDGDTLRDGQLLSGNAETHEITLRAPVSGELVCTVRNHISNSSATLMIPTCGYIFIECQLSNGTNITQWVFEANNTLCIHSTTTITTPTITSDNVGKKSDITVSNNPSTTFTFANQTSSSDPWYFKTDYLIIMGSVLSLLLIVLMVTASFFFLNKRRESNKTQGQNDQELEHAEVRRQRADRYEQPKAQQVEYGQINFATRPQQNDRRMGPDGAPQESGQVEYGQIKFVERPQQNNRRSGPNGVPEESEKVEYGQIKFAERPQQTPRQMGHDGVPQRSEQVEYGQIKFQ